jgi:Ala-tRNA(Pro) deacylase
MAGIKHWLEYLDKKKVRYSHSIHRPAETALEAADAERMPAHEFAKTVVYFSERGFGLAIVPADRLVDLAKVGRLIGSPYMRLATEFELRELFPGCELGAMPPFGEPARLPVFIDADLAREFIAFPLGSRSDAVRMSFADFQRITGPTVACVSVGHDVLA